MAYESAFEKFEATLAGAACTVTFRKAGTLASGDRPELYFFDVGFGAGFDVGSRQVIVGVSGAGLENWQRANRYLSREEKIDVAGLFLKRKLEAAAGPRAEELRNEDLLIAQSDLESLLQSLGIRK